MIDDGCSHHAYITTRLGSRIADLRGCPRGHYGLCALFVLLRRDCSAMARYWWIPVVFRSFTSLSLQTLPFLLTTEALYQQSTSYSSVADTCAFVWFSFTLFCAKKKSVTGLEVNDKRMNTCHARASVVSKPCMYIRLYFLFFSFGVNTT